MKFFSFAALSAVLAATVATVSAQQVVITEPAANATITAGQDFTVRITRPDFQSSSEEVAVVIAYKSCVASPQFCTIGTLGTILYNGVYRPALDPGSGSAAEYQDFSVQVPSDTPKGAAQLNVVHFALIGASLEPWTQTLNESLWVA